MNKVIFFFHAHLPYVKHPQSQFPGRDNFQEVWFYEAVFEVYLPLLYVLEKLCERYGTDKIQFNINFSPTIIDMLIQPYFQERFEKYLSRLLKLSEEEWNRTKDGKAFSQSYRDNLGESYWNSVKERMPLVRQNAESFHKRLLLLQKYYQDNQGDIVGIIKRLLDKGVIELVGQLGTHPLTPMLMDPVYIDFQVKLGMERLRSVFGVTPSGIWLPEEAFSNMLPEILLQNGISYTLLEPMAVKDVYQPGVEHFFKDTHGLAYFLRDVRRTDMIWDREQGYPRNGDYKEFFRDVGWDWKFEVIAPYLYDIALDQEHTTRHPLNIKYYRITDLSVPLSNKDFYNRYRGLKQAYADAGSFVDSFQSEVNPVTVLAFDAELFGHWWYEGCEWLYYTVARMMRKGGFQLTHFRDYYAERYDRAQTVTPAISAWGKEGTMNNWCNSATHDFWLKNQEALDKVSQLAEERYYIDTDEFVFEQILRELLLLQSSDFPFLIYTKGSVEYAKYRIEKHYMRLLNLYKMISTRDIDIQWVKNIHSEDDIFKDINLIEIFAKSWEINGNDYIFEL